jgi:hypothetical protein
VKECGEERKNGEDVNLGDEEKFGGVEVIPMSEFVSWISRISQIEI